MEPDNSGKSFLMLLIPVVIFAACLIASHLIMPENCYLYDNRNFGQLCHTIPVTEPCPICEDTMTATLARVLFAFGIISLVIPFAVGMIQSKRDLAEKTVSLDLNE